MGWLNFMFFTRIRPCITPGCVRACKRVGRGSTSASSSSSLRAAQEIHGDMSKMCVFCRIIYCSLWQTLRQLYHFSTGSCAEVSITNNSSPQIIMASCSPGNPYQQWQWDTSPVAGPSWRKDEAAGKPIV